MSCVKAILKLSPILVLSGLLLGGVDILLAAPAATVTAGLLAFVLDKQSYKRIYSAAIENSKNLIDILFILMISFAMAEVFMASGVGASIIIVAMKVGLTGPPSSAKGLRMRSYPTTSLTPRWGTSPLATIS